MTIDKGNGIMYKGGAKMKIVTTIKMEEATRRKLKILSAELGKTLGETIEMLVDYFKEGNKE